MTQYRQNIDRQQPLASQQINQLQTQNRRAQYQYQQQYYDRVRQQNYRFQNGGNHDFHNDPFFYTAANYRYHRGGIYYETNQYGVDLLRQAINFGYSEGYHAGRADREDGWHFNYRDSYAYRDANFGYAGYYVDQDAYNYYFRQGFRRGYQDGFYSRYQYGHYDNGANRILDGVLGGILILSAITR